MKRYSYLRWIAFTLLIGVNLGTYAQKTNSEKKETGKEEFVASAVFVSSWIDTVNGKKYRVHIVEPGHTLFSISRAYACQKEEIIKDAQGVEVILGDAIYLPYQKIEKAPLLEVYYTGPRPKALGNQVTLLEVVPAVEIKGEPDTERNQKTEVERKGDKDSLKITLLMPLYLYDTNESRSFAYLPFLEGVLTAWAQYQEKSIDLTGPRVYLKVLDVTDQYTTVKEALNDPWTLSSDVLIAAVYTKVFDTLQSFAAQRKIPFIHPLTEQEGMALGNPWYIQCLPSHKTQASELASCLLKKYPQTQYDYVVFDDSSVVNIRQRKQLVEALKKQSPQGESIGWMPLKASGIAKLSSENKHPYLFVGYADKEIALLNSFIALKKSKVGSNCIWVGPSRWMSFSKIETDYFRRFHYICFLSFYTNKEETDVLDFEKAYYHLYGTLPIELAYKGYACTKWLVQMLENYNADFMQHMEEKLPQSEQFPFSLFRWQKRPKGGFENTALHLIQLQNNKYIKIQ